LLLKLNKINLKDNIKISINFNNNKITIYKKLISTIIKINKNSNKFYSKIV